VGIEVKIKDDSVNTNDKSELMEMVVEGVGTEVIPSLTLVLSETTLVGKVMTTLVGIDVGGSVTGLDGGTDVGIDVGGSVTGSEVGGTEVGGTGGTDVGVSDTGGSDVGNEDGGGGKTLDITLDKALVNGRDIVGI
jgi:hypothetical protein